MKMTIAENGLTTEERHALVGSCEAFAVTTSGRFFSRGHTREDLYQCAMLGLVEASRFFDPSLGFKFATFSYWYMLKYLSEAVYSTGPLIAINSEATAEVRRPNPSDETRRHVRVRIEKARAALRSQGLGLGRHRFWDDFPGDLRFVDPATSRLDGLCPVDRRSIAELIGWLEPRQADVVRRHFGIGCEEESLASIAKTADVSRERVRQIKEEAFKILRPLVACFKEAI